MINIARTLCVKIISLCIFIYCLYKVPDWQCSQISEGEQNVDKVAKNLKCLSKVQVPLKIVLTYNTFEYFPSLCIINCDSSSSGPEFDSVQINNSSSVTTQQYKLSRIQSDCQPPMKTIKASPSVCATTNKDNTNYKCDLVSGVHSPCHDQALPAFPCWYFHSSMFLGWSSENL